jgi:hypothetical protein
VPAPVFQQQGDTRLFALSTSGAAGTPGFWAGYCAAIGSPLSGALSTTTVWQDVGGTYLFLGQTPADWTAFLADFDALRPNLGPPGQLRLLWIENAAARGVQWRLTAMQAQSQGSGATISWRTIRATGFRLGHYGVEVAGQGALSQIADGAGGGIAFAGSGSFLGPNGGAAFTPASLAIPFDGPTVASLTASLIAPPIAEGGDGTLWQSFAIGLRYAAPPAPLDETPTPAQIAGQGATRLLFQPVFDGQPTEIAAALAFDPVNPLVGARTHLSLAPTIAAGAVALPSFLRTTLGYPIELTPLAAAGAQPDARFVLGAAPVQGSDPDSGLIYHLSPDGAFQLTVKPIPGGSAGPYQLLAGLSGLEYVEISTDGHQVAFAGGRPAFAVPATDGVGVAPTVADALTDLATTSHATVLPLGASADAVYFAQPRQAPIFSGKTQVAPSFLDFNPMPAATLAPPSTGAPAVFPLGIYSGIEAADAPLARDLENASLAPYRHFQIDTHYGEAARQRALRAAGAPAPPHGPLRRDRAEDDPLGVTPQGLVVELTPDYQAFDGVYIGNMPGTDYPKLDFAVVTGGFKAALQSNQLFFVAADVAVLMQSTSVRYELDPTPKTTARLLAKGVPQANITAVYAALQGHSQPFDTEAAFVACIGAAATPTYLPVYLALGGLLQAQMDGWTFQLSPRAWRPWRDPVEGGGALGDGVASPTVMIAKFCNRPLSELIADSSSWLWPEVAVAPTQGGTLGDTQRLILAIFAQAAAQDPASPYRRFLADVVDNAAWNGFLFLNAPVDIAEMPADLLFLTAGIDTDRFYAHHLGLSQTPFAVAGTTPVLQNTAAFGLIDYDDPVDLYSETTVPFDFKTLQLRARFSNSALVDFSAKAELLVNRLFSDELTKLQTDHGNNLVLDGSYQRVGTVAMYSFALEGRNSYATRASVLSRIHVSTVALQTRGAGDPTSGALVTDFSLSGVLQFDAPQDFDLYSFGTVASDAGAGTDNPQGLRYGGLTVSMSFTPGGDNSAKQFVVDEGALSFDLANSVTRAQSLVSHFPLTLTGLLAVRPIEAQGGSADAPEGTSPEALGFTSVSAPLEQTPLTAPWYGLRFALDLGTLGALLGSVGILVEVLAAWKPGAGDRTGAPQYLGLQIATGPAQGVQWPLQGVLRLGFRSFQFLTYFDDNDLQVYLLRLHQFTLSVLGLLNFPPGNNDIVLFGNPDQTGATKLGWYAAYAADVKAEEKAQAQPGRKRLATPARALAAPAVAVHAAPLRRQETLRRLRAARSGRRPGGSAP